MASIRGLSPSLISWGRSAATSRRWQLLAAVIVYASFTAYLTWPLILDPGSTIYLSPSRPRGDYTSIIAYLHQTVEGGHNPFLPGTFENFNAPHGAPIPWVLNVASFASWIVLYPLGLVFGATAAFGIFAMSGFIASASAMFLLVRRLVGEFWIALTIGFAFGFAPYAVANGEHPHFIHGWVFVLMAWRMIELHQSPSVRNGLIAGVAGLVAVGWTPYFLLFGGVVFGVMMIASLLLAVRDRRFKKLILPELLALSIVVAFFVFIRVLAVIDTGAAAIGVSSLFDLYAQSARPANLLVPTGHNPIVGHWTRPFLQERGWYDAAEKTLYVGVTLCALGILAIGAAVRRRLPHDARHLVVVFAAVTAVTTAFAGPPKWGVFRGIEIPFPSYFVWQLQPGWRIYERFVIVIMLGLCLLAALGLSALVRGRTGRLRIAILALAVIIVPVDLWSKFDNRTGKLEEPAIYRTLRALPPGIVAEYPIEPVAFGLDYDELYSQAYHGKPILNGYPGRTVDEGNALALADVTNPDTAQRLAARGVRYILVKHRSYNPPEFVPPPGRPGKGFRLLKRDSYANIYAVEPARR